MGTLNLLFTLGIIAYSLYSVIVYWSRRSDNKHALRSLRDDGEPVRQLTPDEQSALAPFLFQPGKPDKAMPLKRAGVFALMGEYKRHGIATSGGGGSETFHDTIDDVEVILPYDARDFLEPHCRAEVVFTEKYAIVVSLNGTFELLGGRERAQRRQLQERQWASGQTGAVPDVEPEALGALKAEGVEAEQIDQIEQAMRVEILGQRSETPDEVLARSGPGVGILAGLGFAIALIGLAVASGLEGASRWWGIVPAAAFGVLAVWGVWGRNKLPAAGKVNRVRGHIHAIAVALPGQTVAPVPRLFVGDKVPVELPAHWKAFCEVPQSAPVEVDLRVDDHSAVRFGRALSIDDETRRFKPVYWGRHLTLALVGLIALATVPLWIDGLRNDAVLTAATVQRKEALTIESPAALLGKLPEVGTPVLLKGNARCDWGTGGNVSRFDCARLYWGGVEPQLAQIEVDPVTELFKSGEFIPARSSVRLELMMQMEMARRQMTDPLDAYRYGYGQKPAAPKIVSGVADLVAMVEKNCADGSDACAGLKKALSGALKVEDERQPRDWAGWVKQASAGELTGENADALILADGLSSVQSAGRNVANARLSTKVAAATQQWREQGRGGIVLTSWPGEGTTLPEAPQAADAFAALELARGMAGADGLKPFIVQGLVIESSHPAGGVAEVHVDGHRTLADPWPSVLRVLFVALALALFAVHAVALVVTWRRASARATQLDALNQARVAKAVSFG